jgi:hypothetical protein
LASELFLLNKETQLEFFLETVFRKSKCDCQCLHFDTIAASMRAVLHLLNNHELAGVMTPIQRTIAPYWKDTIRLGSIVRHTKSKKTMETVTDSLMTNISSTRGSHRAQLLQKVILIMVSIRLFQ